jgi:hypothetical protein
MDKNTTKWDKQQQSAYYKEWRKKNKIRLIEYQKKWHEDNKEHINQYREDNSEKISQQQKEWREKHPGRSKQLWNEWYQMNKTRSPKRRFTEAKHAAKKRKINWSLTLEEYSTLITMPCYYCDNKLGLPVTRATGLDRLDSNKGYELSNVVSSCYMCNCMKHMFLTAEEMKFIAKSLIEFRSQKLNVVNTPI